MKQKDSEIHSRVSKEKRQTSDYKKRLCRNPFLIYAKFFGMVL
jgi:hypothetical protein